MKFAVLFSNVFDFILHLYDGRNVNALRAEALFTFLPETAVNIVV